MKPVALALAVCLFAACSGGNGKVDVPAVPYLTKPTDQIVLDRQNFVDTWEAAKILFAHEMKRRKAECSGQECARVYAVEEKAKLVALRVDAKLANREAEVDWSAVKELLSLLAGVVL